MPVADAEYETSSTPSQPGRSTELLPQHICIGLRSDAVSFDACETFQVLCRVVDSTFSHVSAEVLFELRAAAPDARAVRAFDTFTGWARGSSSLRAGGGAAGGTGRRRAVRRLWRLSNYRRNPGQE